MCVFFIDDKIVEDATLTIDLSGKALMLLQSEKRKANLTVLWRHFMFMRTKGSITVIIL